MRRPGCNCKQGAGSAHTGSGSSINAYRCALQNSLFSLSSWCRADTRDKLLALFVCSADGLVLMSSLSLVLDGVLFEPPPPTLAPSATSQANSWALATLNAADGSTQAGTCAQLLVALRSVQTASESRCVPYLHVCRVPRLHQAYRRPWCWLTTVSSWGCKTASEACCSSWQRCSKKHSTRCACEVLCRSYGSWIKKHMCASIHACAAAT